MGDNEPKRATDIVVIFDDEEALVVAFEEFAERGSGVRFEIGILAGEDPIEEVVIAGFVNDLFKGIGMRERRLCMARVSRSSECSSFSGIGLKSDQS